MSIEQFIDNEVKVERRRAVHEGHAAVSAVRFLRPGGADPRSRRRRPTRASTCSSPPICATASRPTPNWPTIPQLYVKGEFVGGCDIIREMFQAGELQQLFADKGVTRQRGARPEF